MSKLSELIISGEERHKDSMLWSILVACQGMIFGGGVDTPDKMETFLDEAKVLVMSEFDNLYQNVHEYLNDMD